MKSNELGKYYKKKQRIELAEAKSSFKDSPGNWCTSVRAHLIELGSRPHSSSIHCANKSF